MLLAASWGLKSFTMSTQAFESDEITSGSFEINQIYFKATGNTIDNKLYFIFHFFKEQQ